MGILNNNQENNQENKSKEPRVCARGAFGFSIEPKGKSLEVGDIISFFREGKTQTFTVEIYEDGKVERDRDINLHAAAQLKPITNEMSANHRNKMMQNDLQVNPVNLHKANNLVK